MKVGGSRFNFWMVFASLVCHCIRIFFSKISVYILISKMSLLNITFNWSGIGKVLTSNICSSLGLLHMITNSHMNTCLGTWQNHGSAYHIYRLGNKHLKNIYKRSTSGSCFISPFASHLEKSPLRKAYASPAPQGEWEACNITLEFLFIYKGGRKRIWKKD